RGEYPRSRATSARTTVIGSMVRGDRASRTRMGLLLARLSLVSLHDSQSSYTCSGVMGHSSVALVIGVPSCCVLTFWVGPPGRGGARPGGGLLLGVCGFDVLMHGCGVDTHLAARPALVDQQGVAVIPPHHPRAGLVAAPGGENRHAPGHVGPVLDHGAALAVDGPPPVPQRRRHPG